VAVAVLTLAVAVVQVAIARNHQLLVQALPVQ
jgi:hypothetical protein